MLILYGGAFNPPTLAHFKIVETILNQFKDAKVIIIPVGDDYQKPFLIDTNHRLEMCKLNFKNLNRVSISDYEVLNPFKGTVSTLDFYHKVDSDIYYVIGDDHLEHLDKWIEYERLLSSYRFMIVTRMKHDINQLIHKYDKLWAFKPHVIHLDLKISSTLLRSDYHTHKDWLNEKVYQYIKHHGLYK